MHGAQASIEHIGTLAAARPEVLLGQRPGAPFGAVWLHAPVHTEVSNLQQHALVLHLAGSTLVEKWRDGRLVGHRSRIGSVSLVPAGVDSGWVLAGHSRVAHVYIAPQRLHDVAAAADGAACSGELRDFFAEEDAVAASLVRAALAHAHAGTLDVLAEDELMSLLLRHLLRRYAQGRPMPAADARLALTASSLRRIFAFIDARLAGELRLAELAAVAGLSEDHFLRAFKAAVGATPHQYLLAQRVVRAQQLLLHSALPIADIARAAGFRASSHFAAAFRQRVGTTPSHWRRQRRH